MNYLSVCSGIEAATVAWHPLGWNPVGFSEIEKVPCAVLQHHYPEVPNLGDMNDFKKWPRSNVDVLVGGTPCQSFSVAGLRQGLDDPRGNLALDYLAIAERSGARWLVWENVPGVLSSDGGRDFGAIIGGMVKLGYGIAYRVLDAQYFGVPQRRRRVFVVGYLGDWRRAAEVLFEPESLLRHPAPSREARQGTAERTKDGPGDRRWPAMTAPTINAHFGDKMGLEDQHALNGAGLFVPDYANSLTSHNGQRNEVSDMLNGAAVVEIAAPLSASNGANSNDGGRRREDDHNLVAFDQNQRDEVRMMDKAGALAAEPGAKQQTYVKQDMAVRRLTPLECERLQGFPDNYTNIPGASDSGRYKALGNSMAVPVMRWIGERINRVENRE